MFLYVTVSALMAQPGYPKHVRSLTRRTNHAQRKTTCSLIMYKLSSRKRSSKLRTYTAGAEL
eukprot:6456457-Amphidinium_carterae.1